jgi:cytochrome P450
MRIDISCKFNAPAPSPLSEDTDGTNHSSFSDHVTKDPDHPHHGIAKFNLLGKIVYHVGGNDEETMRAICLNKDLSFSQGNSFLFAGIQGAGQKGLNEDGELDAEEKREMKHLAQAISPARLNAMAPRLVADTHEAMNEFFASSPGEPAMIDLQQTYYPLVFRFTVRIMGMAEYASSPAELRQLFAAFWATQRNSGFWTTMLPWLPQPRLLKRLWGAFTLWRMVRKTLAQRASAGRREDDYAQDLIDRGLAPNAIARFVIGGLIAGILNTIGTGAYAIAFVGASPALQAECRTALDAGLRRIATQRGADWDALPARRRLQLVTPEEWERAPEFAILHAVFREAIRLLLTNSLNRYYPGPGRDARTGAPRPRLTLYGHAIEDDSYVVFSPASNLHDAAAFPAPLRFDPHRYARGQGAGGDYAFLGWGAGHHKCTGVRLAKLETIVALAGFLTWTARIETTDENGAPYALDAVPLPDLSQDHWRSPTKGMRVRLWPRGDQ